MGAQSHELEHIWIWFAVDQNEIGPEVAIAEVFPLSAERMVAKLCRRRDVIDQIAEDRCKLPRQRATMRALLFALVVAPETRGLFNRPYRATSTAL